MKRLLTVAAVLALALAAHTLVSDLRAQEEAAEKAPAADAPKADAPAPETAPAADAAKDETPKIDPAFEKDIRRLLTLLKLEKSVRNSLTAAFNQFKARAPQIPEQRWADALAKINWSEVVDITVPFYAKNMTHEDVKATLAFYESPAGTRFMAAQDAVAQEGQAANREWVQKIIRKVLADVAPQAQQPLP